MFICPDDIGIGWDILFASSPYCGRSIIWFGRLTLASWLLASWEYIPLDWLYGSCCVPTDMDGPFPYMFPLELAAVGRPILE
jgi:hypothetical protein